MTYLEASIILNINHDRIRELVKKNILRQVSHDKKVIDPESVYEYKKELDYRRSLKKPVWIKTGGD